MASVVFETPFAFSETGKYLSYCGNDGKLKIWDTSTGVLKQEYTKNLHLSSPCSCLIWLETSKSKFGKKRKLNTAETLSDFQDVIAIGTSHGSVMLYSVGTNSILSEASGHGDRVNDLSSSKSSLFSCSDDRNIIQWDLSKHKVKSKWKAGKERLKSILALSCGEKLVTASCSIKLWDIETQQILKSFVGHASNVFKLLEVPGGDSYFISAAKGDRMISAWSLTTNEQPGSSVASFLLQDSAASLHINGEPENSTLCAVSESGVLHVFGYKLNGATGKPVKPKLNVTIASELEGGKTVSTPLPIHAALCLKEDSIRIAYGNPALLLFETLVLSEHKEEHIVLLRQVRRRVTSDEFNNRIRVPDTQGDVEYIKGGATGGSAALRKLRDVPLAQRLENLELVPGVDVPRKDNMSQLLVQGLQSRDRDLIHDVLFRREESVINSTVRNLPIQALVPLLRELSTLLQGKTFTSRVAVGWLNAVLRSHAAMLLANPELKDMMIPLAATIEAKIGGLSGLLRLQGRLGLVTEQMTSEAADDSLDEPLVTYQERDESSESEPMSESDEAEEWDEFSDMDEDGEPE